MSRFSSSSMEARSEAARVAFRQFVDIGVTSGTMRAVTGNRYMFVNGNTYSPVGFLGGIDPIQEESDPFPHGLRMWLAAVSSAQLYEPLRESMFGRPVTVYEAFINPDLVSLSGLSPETAWKGQINEVEIHPGDPERGNYYEVVAETELRREARSVYFNLETHWETYSGDTFFSFLADIPGYRSKWGQDDGVRYRKGVRGRYQKGRRSAVFVPEED